MCVKYQDNLIIPFSDNVCDKLGKLGHCIIPVSDNVRDISYLVKFSEYVCDISGKLHNCVIPFSDNVCDISGQLLCQRLQQRKRRRKKVTAELVGTKSLPVNGLTATNCNAATHANFLTMCVTYHKNCINSLSHFPTMSVTYPNHTTFWLCMMYNN